MTTVVYVRAAFKVGLNAHRAYVHMMCQRCMSAPDAYLNMGDGVWQVEEGPSC